MTLKEIWEKFGSVRVKSRWSDDKQYPPFILEKFEGRSFTVRFDDGRLQKGILALDYFDDYILAELKKKTKQDIQISV